MFASRTVAEHLARGVVGMGALACAMLFAPHVWPPLLLLPIALVALRGCPLCWTMGLAQTLWARARGRRAEGCIDGACARRSV